MRAETRGRKRAWQALGAAAVVFVAFAALMTRLNDVPPGIQHDQVFNIVDAIELLYGRYRIYFTANFGREPLFIYSAAALFRLANGDFIWGLRLASVVWATLGVAMSISLALRKLPFGAALVAVLLMAGSFWFLFTGRVGLRAISAMTLGAGMLYWLDRGTTKSSVGAFTLSGLFGGLAIYTYLSARALLALAPLLLLFELLAAGFRRFQRQRARSSQRIWRDTEKATFREAPLLSPRPVWQKQVSGLLLSWLVMLAVSAPLLLWLRANPGAERRVGELAGPLGQAARGDLLPLVHTVAEGAGTLLWRDTSELLYQYNLPGRPALLPLLAVLFVIGLGVSLPRLLRSRRERLWLTALALGLGPALITPGGPLYLRAIIALPLIFVYVAAGLWAFGGMAQRARPRLTGAQGRWRAVAALLIVALVAGHWAEAAWSYFLRWPAARETQRVYNADLRAAAAYSAKAPPEEKLYISTDFWLDLDQQTYLLYRPARSDIGWFFGPRGLPLPPVGSVASYIWTASAGNAATALGGLNTSAPQASGLLQVARLDAVEVDQLLAEAGVRQLDAPLQFGKSLELVEAGSLPSGNGVEVITRWKVLQPWGQNLPPKAAVRLVDGAGQNWVQADDTFALAYQGWQTGQEFVQVTHLALPGDMPAGEYGALVSVYDDQNGATSVFRNGRPLATDAPALVVSIAPQTPRAPSP